MPGPSHGEIFFDAYNTASSIAMPPSRFEQLRSSTKRLWEAAAAAVIDRELHVAVAGDFGALAYDAFFQETGLPENHFVRFEQLCDAAQLQWRWGAVTARRHAGLQS